MCTNRMYVQSTRRTCRKVVGVKESMDVQAVGLTIVWKGDGKTSCCLLAFSGIWVFVVGGGLTVDGNLNFLCV